MIMVYSQGTSLVMWNNPVDFQLIPTADSMSFQHMPSGCTGLPLAPHPGAYGVRRAHHTHEGVDLYVPEGACVKAVEPGQVVAVRQFTGPELGHSWWARTWAVWIAGPTGVVVYGEIRPCVHVGAEVAAGDLVGHVVPVLLKNKGRPVSMLHLELRQQGGLADIEWRDHDCPPNELRDPTPFLLACAKEKTDGGR